MNDIQTNPGFAAPVREAHELFKAALQAFSGPGRCIDVFAVPPAPFSESEANNPDVAGQGSTTGWTACGTVGTATVGTAEEQSESGAGIGAGFGTGAGRDARPGRGMTNGMTALALTLCDLDTPVWLDAECDTAGVRKHLRFHCGCPVTGEPSGALFAFIGDAVHMPRLEVFGRGMAEYPERSATLVIRAGLNGAGERLDIRGPGVKGAERGKSAACFVSGLPEWFRQDWRENHASYPMGVDVLFVDDAGLSAPLPYFTILGLPRSASLEPLGMPDLRNKEGSVCMSR